MIYIANDQTFPIVEFARIPHSFAGTRISLPFDIVSPNHAKRRSESLDACQNDSQESKVYSHSHRACMQFIGRGEQVPSEYNEGQSWGIFVGIRCTVLYCLTSFRSCG